MDSIEISFNLWYPSAEFWSHPFWFWYMLVGVVMLVLVNYLVVITGAKWKGGSPKLYQFLLVSFCYPYWVVRAIVKAAERSSSR